MSETIEDAVTDPAPPTDPAPEPQDTASVEEAIAESDPEPEPEPKPRGVDRRIAHLTARLATTAAEAAEAQRRADAAEALLRSGKEDEPVPAPRETLDQAVARKIAEKEFTERLGGVVKSGVKELGAEKWEEKTKFISEMGAYDHPAFLPALIELDHAPKIVAALADDPDLLADLLTKTPAALAAKLGRMDAQMEKQTETKTPISRAPRPVAPVTAASVAPEITVYQTDKTSMKEWAAMRAKQAPRHLGGRG